MKNSSKKTQGFGKSTWSTCRKRVQKKVFLMTLKANLTLFFYEFQKHSLTFFSMKMLYNIEGKT